MKKFIFIIMIVLLLSFVEAQVFDDTNITAANDIYEQTKALNDVLDGQVGMAFVLAIFAISFVLVTGNTGDALSGLTAAGFWTTFTSIVFLPLGLITYGLFKVVLLVFALSIATKTIAK